MAVVDDTSLIYWLIAIAALIGVWLNIRKRVECFWIWSITNAVWAYVDAVHGIYPQAALQAIYFVLSVYGIWSWTRRQDLPATDARRVNATEGGELNDAVGDPDTPIEERQAEAQVGREPLVRQQPFLAEHPLCSDPSGGTKRKAAG